jgi:retron-type reverse transcriptase
MSLWEEFISKDNFALALKRAAAGKKNKRAIAEFMKNSDDNLEAVRRAVLEGDFRTAPYRTMEIAEPKKQTIYILPFAPDRIVHHALMNILAPIWESSFIKDSYSCITGRGLHAASRRAMDFCRGNQFVLKCDIRKFYPSINHGIMFRIVEKSISEPRILEILRDIIYSSGGEKNLPIGNLCSQWLGNLYMHQLDIFVKQKLRVKCYLRYCDDFCLFLDDKKQLHKWREQLGVFLAQQLRLEFSKSEIFPVSTGLDFVGYRHFKDFVLLRKRTMKKIKLRMLKIGEAEQIPPERLDKARGQVASANGWLKFACSRNLRKRLKFGKLKTKTGIKK